MFTVTYFGEHNHKPLSPQIVAIEDSSQLFEKHIPEKQYIPQQLNNNINEVVNFINVDVPHVSSTNQVDELIVLEDFLMAKPEQESDPQIDKVLLELDNHIDEPEDRVTKLDTPHVSSTNQLGEILELNNLVAEAAKLKEWDTEVVDFDDNVNWVSQPDVFVKQGLSFLSNNQQH
ncbi:hypothetical protein QL285_057765 [Trifolium repens]|nr:hypothetical protein QL285_057765 [Trifolium repens]